ncbi:MAG: sigma-54-dependent Fis family transcriptional regulator [Fibrobacteres bacterium]|nr:sigma-54-dependent Fis family transcriptional regulator [Fibrobacterota bacterium]
MESSDKRILLIHCGDLKGEEENLTSLPGFTVVKAPDSQSALKILSKDKIRIVIMDVSHACEKGVDLISYIKVNLSGCEIIVLADFKDIELATRAIRQGAYLYLVKPVKVEDLKTVVEKVSLRQEKELKYLESQTRLMHDLVGGNEKMARSIAMANKVARTDSTILVTGESGSGKEVFARYIHMKSKRADGPFVAVNCGALPENLIESELFGHVKGAFTGAVMSKKGLIEEANQGTLFLDEVGELLPSAQVKLLRFLQDTTVRQVGGTDERVVDVRIMAATNRNLAQAVEEGKFREDLFYRLNVIHITLPPLRERKENISKLAAFFTVKYSTQMDKAPPVMDPHAMAILQNYSFPGNIRELENVIERAVILSEGGIIKPEDLPPQLIQERPKLAASNNAVEEELLSLQELEKRHIERVLQKLNYNQSLAARHLGLSRTTLWRKIKEHGIQV